MATGELCGKVSDVLLQSAKERERCIVVHRCESIVQVVRHKPDTSVDFIIFAYDGRVTQPLSEVNLIIFLKNWYKYIECQKSVALTYKSTPGADVLKVLYTYNIESRNSKLLLSLICFLVCLGVCGNLYCFYRLF